MLVHTELELLTTFWLKIGVERMEWPAKSPDMNPIENGWGHDKEKNSKTNSTASHSECFE